MKHLKKIFALFMVMAMLCSSAVGVAGESPSLEEKIERRARIWGSLSRLTDKIPEEYTSYFSKLISLKKDEEAYLNITEIKWYPDNNSILVSVYGYARTLSNKMDDFGQHFSLGHASLRAMILQKDTGVPISYYNLGYDYPAFDPDLKMQPDDAINYNDILLVLPDDFDTNTHEIILYWDITKYRGYGVDDDYISAPSKVSLSSENYFGNGDFNMDGEMNISDVSLILQYIGRWDIPKSNYNINAGNVNSDNKINLTDCALILKKIAKWDINFQSYYQMERRITEFDDYYNKQLSCFLHNGQELESEFFWVEDPSEGPYQLRRIIMTNVWEAKYIGFTFEEVHKHYMKMPELRRICVLLGCTAEELETLIYESYNAEWIG